MYLKCLRVFLGISWFTSACFSCCRPLRLLITTVCIKALPIPFVGCWGFIVPVIYGGVIELLQLHAFSQRSAEWGDWIADILGSLVATLLIIIFLKKRDYSKKKISL